jgi:hypothetical protein
MPELVPERSSVLTPQRVAELYDLPVELLFGPWNHGRDVPCDERCVCPVHSTPLLYAPASDEHACQDVNCRHGHGMAGS